MVVLQNYPMIIVDTEAATSYRGFFPLRTVTGIPILELVRINWMYHNRCSILVRLLIPILLAYGMLVYLDVFLFHIECVRIHGVFLGIARTRKHREQTSPVEVVVKTVALPLSVVLLLLLLVFYIHSTILAILNKQEG